jgi:hypothetical protein
MFFYQDDSYLTYTIKFNERTINFFALDFTLSYASGARK